jgi:NAD+ kinase
MSDVVLVAHHGRVEAAALARSAAQWLAAHGHHAWMLADDAAALDVADLAAERAVGSADLVVSLGGDGTMLRAVKSLQGADVPVLGVNVGLLGYLAEIEPHVMSAALERWSAGPAEGQWHVEERMMLRFDVHRSSRSGDEPESFNALNEGVVEKCEAGHTVRLAVGIDGAPFASYAADGLIVATPTGSTAYSFSARGPVVSPRHRAILLTPVSPHMLFDRALVLDPEETVQIEVIGHRLAQLSVDGQGACTLSEGDIVRARTADGVARFIRFGERRFHQVLKAKFGLADR